MTNVVGEAFVVMQQSSKKPVGTALVTQEVLRIPHGAVLVAIDSEGGRHILVPIGAADVREDRRSRSVTLTVRTLQLDTITERFADLACSDPDLSLVFERVVSDVVARLEAGSPSETVCSVTLAEWRSLLLSAKERLARETAIGLIGELEVLARLGKENPIPAVETWTGPDRHVHDFASPSGSAIEVKSTTGTDGNYVQISNLDQLDPTGVTDLHLVVCVLRFDPSCHSLDERIRDMIDTGFPRDALLEKVASYGYVFESPSEFDTRFRVRWTRVWNVGLEFPGLRRAELGESRLRGVGRVNYELSLDAAPARLSNDSAARMFEAWGEAL